MIGSRLLPAIALAAAGCSILPGQGADPYATWSADPLPLDPPVVELASDARCQPTDHAAMPMVAFDSRATAIGYALYSDGRDVSDCFFPVSGESGGPDTIAIGPTSLEPLVAPVSIDSRGSLAGHRYSVGTAHGRMTLPTVRLEIRLLDGRVVRPTISDGYWLAWWIGNPDRMVVVAFGADDRQVAKITTQ